MEINANYATSIHAGDNGDRDRWWLRLAAGKRTDRG
jgi:hypothetical protein